MVARLLAEHPAVETLIQPFSSTEVHRTQWEIWDANHSAPGPEAFLKGLQAGQLDRSFIEADWFERFSTTDRLRPGTVHVIKETKLHFKLGWLRERFPAIPVFGLYRDLRGIVGSLVRNGFHETWYGGAFEEVEPVVRADGPLAERYGGFFDTPPSPAVRMGVIVAVRTEVMARSLDPAMWIAYEGAVEDCNTELGGVLQRLGLEPFDFRPSLDRDYNIVGRGYEGTDAWKQVLSRADADALGVMDHALRKVAVGR